MVERKREIRDVPYDPESPLINWALKKKEKKQIVLDNKIDMILQEGQVKKYIPTSPTRFEDDEWKQPQSPALNESKEIYEDLLPRSAFLEANDITETNAVEDED